MKHGCFLATISSSILLASPLYAVWPTLEQETQALERFLSAFEPPSEWYDVCKDVTMQPEDFSYYEEREKLLSKGEQNAVNLLDIKNNIVRLRRKIYEYLDSREAFSRVHGGCKVEGCNTLFVSIGRLALYLISKYYPDIDKLRGFPRLCYFIIMIEILKSGFNVVEI